MHYKIRMSLRTSTLQMIVSYSVIGNLRFIPVWPCSFWTISLVCKFQIYKQWSSEPLTIHFPPVTEKFANRQYFSLLWPVYVFRHWRKQQHSVSNLGLSAMPLVVRSWGRQHWSWRATVFDLIANALQKNGYSHKTCKSVKKNFSFYKKQQHATWSWTRVNEMLWFQDFLFFNFVSYKEGGFRKCKREKWTRLSETATVFWQNESVIFRLDQP